MHLYYHQDVMIFNFTFKALHNVLIISISILFQFNAYVTSVILSAQQLKVKIQENTNKQAAI